MDYEIVRLSEKTVAGLMARTSNSAPDMNSVIGNLWGQFYQSGIYNAIPNKKNGKVLGIYTDYENNEKGEYSIITACEVEEDKNIPDGASVRKLSAGTYAKFIVKGELHKAVADFWGALWNMDLPRAFLCDFEEYQNSDPENSEIHMYISLKE